ncbi:unnamed protein product [Orchesella dallaii]|uniref:Uncharacterized protein n=1 Tax=Orchesella dallaii TaxID=48710 RepID=A0ABP1RJR4_9HEXA
MVRDPASVASLFNQAMTAGGVQYEGWPNSKRLPNIKELSACALAAGFFQFPQLTTHYPLRRPYDPTNILLENDLSQLPQRLLASFIHGIVVLYAANNCAEFIFMVLTCVKNLQIETEKNYKLSTGEYEETKAAVAWIEHNFTRVQEQIQPETPLFRDGSEIDESRLSLHAKFRRRFNTRK